MAALFGQFAITPTASAKDKPWLRVTTPEFVVITDLKEKQATAWAAEFSQYIAALRENFQMQDRHLQPLTMVVFEWERDFLDHRPLDLRGKPKAVGGFFSRHESWAVAGMADTEMTAELRRTIFHEGTHWFMSGQNRPNPNWLEEGLAEVFSTFAVTKNQAEWGRLINAHVTHLGRVLPIPLEKLLFTAQNDLFADESERTGYFYAESWLFVHFLLFGRQDIPRAALLDYKNLLYAGGMHPDEAFKRTFGRSYAQMESQLSDYLRSGNYAMQRQPLAAVGKPTVAQATNRDVEEALGRLDLGARRWESAQEHARAVITWAPDDPRGFEMLGSARYESGDVAGSLEPFMRATQLGSRDFFPYFELAHAEHSEVTSGPIELNSITPEAARRMANLYEQAINLYTRFLPSYQALASLVGVMEPWSIEDRRFLELGQKLFQGDELIGVGLAILSWRAGDRDTARSQLTTLLAKEQWTAGAKARNYARQLDERWTDQALTAKINQLIQAKEFNQIVKIIDDQLAKQEPDVPREQLMEMRRQLEFKALEQSAQHAYEAQNWTEARRLLAELDSSDAPGVMKMQATRALEDLDRRGLGRDTP